MALEPEKLSDQPPAQIGSDADLYMVVQSGETRKQTRVQTKTALGIDSLVLSNNGVLHIDSLGANGNGSFDNSAILTAAFATGKKIIGDPKKIYGVSGNFEMPDAPSLENLKLKQLNPNSTSRRTLTKTSGVGPVVLRNVTVLKNGAMTDGSITDAAGIWISNIPDVTLENVEVTGNSKGSGVVVTDFTNLKLIRPNIHDMRWSDTVDPGTEQILGLRIERGVNVSILEPNTYNLDGVIGAGSPRAYQTDGISIGQCSRIDIIGGEVRNVGEGIDLTGGGTGNSSFNILGVRGVDIDSFGFKFANSASNGNVVACIAERCGFSGFVVSGASAAGLPNCEDITFSACKAISTGSNGNWAASATAGFGVLQGSFDVTFPEGITFVDCEAIDEQGSPTMKYGFRSEPAITTVTKRPNRMINCHSEGHTISRKLGPIQEPESFGYAAGRYYGGGGNVTATATLALTANVLYASPYEVFEEVLFTKIGIYVQTAVAGNARIGIYSAKDGLPDALMLDAGTVSTGTTGVKELTISKYLPRGKYFIGLVSDATATIYGAVGNVNHVDRLGAGTPGVNDTQISRTFTYAALPAAFGTVVYAAAAFPIPWMRL